MVSLDGLGSLQNLLWVLNKGAISHGCIEPIPPVNLIVSWAYAAAKNEKFDEKNQWKTEHVMDENTKRFKESTDGYINNFHWMSKDFDNQTDINMGYDIDEWRNSFYELIKRLNSKQHSV
jgi:hypothetical protein